MARGDYTGRVRTTSTDEVGRLAAVFNQMAGDPAVVEAERRDLIATVSHELRTPLAAMIAVLENLADGVVPADAEHLDGALAQAERLRRLVTDLLELSRLEAGVTRLQPTAVPVRALVADCIAEVAAAGRTGGVRPRDPRRPGRPGRRGRGCDSSRSTSSTTRLATLRPDRRSTSPQRVRRRAGGSRSPTAAPGWPSPTANASSSVSAPTPPAAAPGSARPWPAGWPSCTAARSASPTPLPGTPGPCSGSSSRT
ncbi:HAMP domain-containing protein [Nocardioides sp. B-3]|nr:HAMP domain-containing protein [Nocardioides sp. B-3]